MNSADHGQMAQSWSTLVTSLATSRLRVQLNKLAMLKSYGSFQDILLEENLRSTTLPRSVQYSSIKR
jgi:hypothetical protein